MHPALAATLLSFAVAGLTACDRERTPAAAAADASSPSLTVTAAPPAGTASTPMPVGPMGVINANSKAEASDRTQSTAAGGTSNQSVLPPLSASAPIVSSQTTGSAIPASSPGVPAATNSQGTAKQQ